jgi:hypothetical protein
MANNSKILEAAITLYKHGIAGMRSETIIKYFDICAKFTECRKTMKYTESLESTADCCFCSPELVKAAIAWRKKIDKNN